MSDFESRPNSAEREERKQELIRLKERKFLPWDLGEVMVAYGSASGDDVSRFERLSFENMLAEIIITRDQKKADFAADPEIRQLEIDVLNRIWNEFAARADEKGNDRER